MSWCEDGREADVTCGAERKRTRKKMERTQEERKKGADISEEDS